jgi:hypothetical protein
MEPLSRNLLWWSLAGLALLGVMWLVAWSRGSVARDLDRMDPTERGALYQRTLEDLRTCARTPTEALQPWCEEQAAFIRNFPECDESCRTLARTFAPRSTR